MTNEARAAAAHIIINSALDEMVRTSGATHGEILDVILADPAGAAAIRFRKLVALGNQALASL